MGQYEKEYDGTLISELGVKRYLKAQKDIKLSNINFLVRGEAANKAWKKCNFGCHGPTYRSLKRPSSYAELLKPIDDSSPLLAGIIDGVHHQTIGNAEKVGGGMKRTAEGLMLAGEEKFQAVGNENLAAFEFSVTAFDKALSFDLEVLDNPITQTVMVIIAEYIAVLPEWIIEEAISQRALKIPDKIDAAWLMKAAAIGIVKEISREQLDQAASFLNSTAQRTLGKQIGKKLAPAMGAALASKITRNLIRNSAHAMQLKRQLVRYRKLGRPAKGGLGRFLLTLLKTQGLLNKAGESSRRLNQCCPRVWNTLRYQLNGANMVYFLIEGMVQEYVDRLSLLENNPKEFAKVMAALIRDKQTPQIFFPS